MPGSGRSTLVARAAAALVALCVLAAVAQDVPPAAVAPTGAAAAAAAGLRPEAPAAVAARTARHDAATRLADAGLAYLRRAQNPDGSWGALQTRFQTGLAILAFLSAGDTPDSDPAHPVTRAARWLLDHSGDDGALGDSDYPAESHAAAALALSELVGMLPDPALAAAAERRADQALAYTLRTQDRAVGAEYYGGWKADPKDKLNDRPATAWQLLFLRSMQLRGRDVPRSATANALQFLEGSQKIPGPDRTYDRADVGGFSYDAAGLPVVSVTGAGFGLMGLYDRAPARRDAALAWLERNRPIWFGPRFFLAHFFAARGYAREVRRGSAGQADRYAARLLDLLRDHQNPDGSFQLPAGNAENTLKMGGTYATAMAVLILDAERGFLPVDAW